MSAAPGVRISTLPNGLRVATDTMPSLETAAVGIWVEVGTRDESAAFNGVAHLLEHMAFKGTHRRTARGIAEEIETVGGQLNAYTSRENTAYYARVLAPDVPLAVDIVADILQHSTMDAAELERERGVILQEIGQAEDTPDDLVFDHFQATAYPDQALGRPVLGRAEIVRRLTGDEIRGYMHRHYGPSCMVLAAGGRVDHDRLVELAAAFSELPADAIADTEPARYAGGDSRTERDLEQVHLVLGFAGLGFRDPDYYAASVVAMALGGGMSSRLFQEVREKRGLVYNISSFTAPYRDGGLLAIYAGTGETEAAEVLALICGESTDFAATLTEADIARARAQMKAGILMGRESPSTRCEQLAQQLLIFDRPLPTEEIVARIEEVDVTAARRVLTRILSSRPTLACIGPVSRVESYDRLAARLS